MSRAFVMTLQRPHETLGIPMPVGRRLGELGRYAWAGVLVCAALLCAGIYIYQVNATATKGYTMRALEKKSENLQETVASLEAQTAKMQTVKALEGRVKALGYVPIDRMEFLEGQSGGYALAR